MDIAGVRTSNAGIGALVGTATTVVAGGACSVNIGEIIVSALAVKGLTVAVGDILLLHRVGAVYWVANVCTVTAPPPPVVPPDPPPPPKPTVVTGSLVCAAIETRSYRAGKWRTDTDDVVQGVTPGQANSTGCAFYGSKPRSLAGATVTKATLRVRRDRGGSFAASTATLRLMTQAVRPAGAPTLTSTTTGPSIPVGATQAAFVLPTSWAQGIVDGTSGGLAVFDGSGSPYIRFQGRGGYGPAFTLTIAWRR